MMPPADHPPAHQAGQRRVARSRPTALRPERRSIAVVASPGLVSAALKAAIEWQFPWLSISMVETLDMLLSQKRDGLDLLLLDLSLADQLDQHWVLLKRRHPEIAIAFLAETPELSDAVELRRYEPRHVRGLLALDVRLDVFLSCLGVVLHGGTHFAIPAFLPSYSPAQSGKDEHFKEEHDPRHDTRPDPRPRVTSCLTEREREVLAQVARGSQNKNIAARLGVSEHTVKIHIHNLINKLGVHNRTEAASIYLREAHDRPPVRLPPPTRM